MPPHRKGTNVNRNYFCVQLVVAPTFAKGSHDESTDRSRPCRGGPRPGVGWLHQPLRPWPARGRRRPARRRRGGGYRRCGCRRAWRRSWRGDRGCYRRRNRRCFHATSSAAAGRLRPGLRISAASSGRLWPRLRISAAAVTERRVRLPDCTAAYLPVILAVRLDWRSGRKRARPLQPGGVDLISSARCRTFAAGGKFFPTADASIRRGWFGRGAGSAEGCRPVTAGVPVPQSPERSTSTFGGAPVPGSE
jgi:hypothetical protein